MIPDPRHLIGGYATGNLSPEERRRLFAAALEDPDLFAALADEEAFKDLLSDPEAAQSIRAALAPRVRPFWRRPVLLGSAAGLLFVASTTALLWRGRPAPSVPAASPALPRVPAGPAPQAAAPAPAAKVAVPRQKTPQSDQPAPQPQPAAPPEALEDGPRTFRVAPDAPLQKVQTEVPADVPKAFGLEIARPAERFAAAEALAATPISAPRMILLPEGHFRVEAPPPGSRHAYLLRRRGAAVDVLPARRVPSTGWLHFEGQLEPDDRLDFYLLENPNPAPTALPATGPVAGQRTRLYPSSP